jgi:hypothetical protein
MTDYILKYQVWNGEVDGKQATFRSKEDAMRYLLDIKHSFPDSFIYDALAEEKL